MEKLMNFLKKKIKSKSALVIGAGPSVLLNKDAIVKFVKKRKPAIFTLNSVPGAMKELDPELYEMLRPDVYLSTQHAGANSRKLFCRYVKRVAEDLIDSGSTIVYKKRANTLVEFFKHFPDAFVVNYEKEFRKYGVTPKKGGQYLFLLVNQLNFKRVAYVGMHDTCSDLVNFYGEKKHAPGGRKLILVGPKPDSKGNDRATYYTEMLKKKTKVICLNLSSETA